jgi:hypothetical protein
VSFGGKKVWRASYKGMVPSSAEIEREAVLFHLCNVHSHAMLLFCVPGHCDGGRMRIAGQLDPCTV